MRECLRKAARIEVCAQLVGQKLAPNIKIARCPKYSLFLAVKNSKQWGFELVK